MLTVQQLPADRLDDAVEAIAGGFEQERNFAHIFSDQRKRRTMTTLLTRMMTGVAARHGGVYVAVEDGEIIGGVVGYPPGVYPFSLGQELRLAPTYLQMFLAGPRMAVRLLRMYAVELAHHPQGERYWYLFAIAVRPGDRSLLALQQMFAAVLERIDADGAAVLLETTRPELVFGVSRYHGFEVREEGVRLAKDGPRNWYLWRRPRATSGSVAG
jgi:hypothetical protein